MLNNLMTSINAVFPLVALMGIGFILNKKNWLNETSREELNKIIFRIFLPVLLLMNIYNAEIESLISGKLLGFVILVTILSVLIALFIFLKLSKDHKKRGPLIQGAFRSNFIFFGIPIVFSLYGQEGVALVVVVIAIVVPLYNFTSVLVLEGFSDGKKAMANIAKNPLIIGTILGLIIKYTGVDFPIMIEDTLNMMSTVATPIALVTLGSSIGNRKLSDHEVSLIVTSSSLKLVGFPLMFLSLAILIGFRDLELTIIMMMLGAPTAISSYTMAAEMGADEDIASSIVVITTVCSVITIFTYIFILKTIGLI